MEKVIQEIQERFRQSTNWSRWQKLQQLLFSEDKENVVMGISLLQSLIQRYLWMLCVRCFHGNPTPLNFNLSFFAYQTPKTVGSKHCRGD